MHARSATILALCLWLTSATVTTLPAQTATATLQDGASAAQAEAEPALATAPKIEIDCLNRLLADASWPRRAIACLRLERFACRLSQQKLEQLTGDPAWQVRAFALRSLARRGVPPQQQWLADESEPRVLRTALRLGYDMDQQRLERGVSTLAKSGNLKHKILAAELAAASGDPSLLDLAADAIKQVILRMNRAEAGAFSPRLAALTGQRELYRPLDWQQWLRKTGRALQIKPAAEQTRRQQPTAIQPAAIAQLDPEQFVGLESYMVKLGEHKVDLAICLDCTASMGREIAAAQAGIDDMMLFIGDVVASLHVGLVAYRDRQDDFEVKAWPFSDNLQTLRQQLWQLTADGGGDHPEAVYPAIRWALSQLQWRAESQKVLVIVGDAPPHVGFGSICANAVKASREQAQLITHTIEVKGKKVDHFAEIAEAGGGRCVALQQADALIAEITGLTLGDRYQDEFREFFQVYLELCR